MQMLILRCEHEPKTHRLIYSCAKTGDYALELCAKCHQNESKDHLIKDEPILVEIYN